MIRVSPPSSAPSPPSVPQARLHLDFLDGVRALAALYVVVHHLYLARFGMSARAQWPGVLGNALLYGHLAVGVFLVLSGFCLGLPGAARRELKGGARTFYQKRARRILPPYFAALFGSIALFWLRHRFAGGEAVHARDVVFNLLLLQDVLPASNTFNAPLWSVALEWKIYFLFPAFVGIWRRFGSWALLGAGVLSGTLLTLAWLQLDSSRSWGHSCPWFVALFALGVAASGVARGETPSALLWRARMPLVAVVSALALAVLLWQFPVTGRGEGPLFVPMLPFIDSATGLLTTALLVLLTGANRCNLFKRVLEWRPLVFVGGFAYSLYLTHEPLLRVLMYFFKRTPALVVVGLPFSLVVAWAFFWVFERPFLSRRPDTSPTL